MLDRMGMIGQIRTKVLELRDSGQSETVNEVMGDIDVYNFVGVSDAQVLRIWGELVYSKTS